MLLLPNVLESHAGCTSQSHSERASVPSRDTWDHTLKRRKLVDMSEGRVQQVPVRQQHVREVWQADVQELKHASACVSFSLGTAFTNKLLVGS